MANSMALLGPNADNIMTKENLEADVIALRQQLSEADREVSRLAGLAQRGLENLENERAVSRSYANQLKGIAGELADAKRLISVHEATISRLYRARKAAKKATAIKAATTSLSPSPSSFGHRGDIEVALL